MAKKHSLHDRLFRETFSRVSEAKLFFKHFLPEDISEYLDLETLKLQNTSFVNERLESHFSDIVYSCQWENSSQEAFLTFILEHKSYPEKHPHLQLMRYMLEGYTYQLKQNKNLSLIIPVVLYHGKEQWNAKPFKEYFELPDPYLQRFVPSFDFIMVNLAKYADEQILAIGMSFLASSLLLFKHKQDKNFVLNNYRQIFIFVEGYQSKAETLRYLRTLILYVFQSFDIEEKEIHEIIEDLPKNVSDMFISTYDQAVESGEIRGIKKGEQIGIKKGEQIGIKKGEQIGIKKGEQIGIKKGEEIGLEKGARMVSIETALAMLTETPDLSDETIARIVKMPVEFVAGLRSCLENKDEKAAQALVVAAFKDVVAFRDADLKKMNDLVTGVFQNKLK
jgi:predicted transposase/invertase (TIGR01784 family)